ncbi:MAG: zinc ribbon domain-containing protein [Deltaproteobacteria bacterium]|nr:zinc ribbon domain-containing protein [Deltaproteobacteria bacterium]
MSDFPDRKCPNCGATLIGGTHRCHYCGADFKPAGWIDKPPPPHVLSFVALALAIVAVFFAGNISIQLPIGGACIAIGLLMLTLVKRRPDRFGGRNLALAAMVIAVAAMMLGIVIRISVQRLAEAPAPTMTGAQSSVYSSGRNAMLAQKMFYEDQAIMNPSGRPSYAGDLKSLLQYDKSLTVDSSVTFIFGSCNQSGYTFTVKHAESPAQFVMKE